MKIELQQTSSRHIFVAYLNREEIGEFRGYGKTDNERIESAREQAKQAIEKRKAK
jgi:hypothetical protein